MLIYLYLLMSYNSYPIKIFFIFLFYLFLIPISVQKSKRCFYILSKNYVVYDLNELQRKESISKDREFQYNIDNNFLIKYNFCDTLINTCNSVKASIIKEDKNSCSVLSGNAIENNKMRLINEEDPNEGVIIDFNDGEPCKTSGTPSSVKWNIKCNEEAKLGEIYVNSNITTFDENKCEYIFYSTSKDACPKVNFYIISSFLIEYKSFIGAIIIVFGLFLCILGLKVLKITIFFTTTAFSFILLFVFMFIIILPRGTDLFVVWIVAGCSIGLGILFGIVGVYYRRIFFTIMGGMIGFIIGNIFFVAVLSHIQWNSTLLYILTLLIFIIVFAIISYFFMKIIIILGTSMIGSYSIIWGISLYAGHYPSESIIIDLINRGEREEIDKLMTWHVYIYISSMFILFIISVVFQFMINKNIDLGTENISVNNKSDNESEKEGSEYEIKRRLV